MVHFGRFQLGHNCMQTKVILLVQKVPALRAFWDLGKTMLHKIRVSGTVVNPLLTQNPQLVVAETMFV